MVNINSRTFKTVTLTASKGFVSMSGLVLLMLLSRLLSEEDYGGLRQLTSLGYLALPLLLLGLPQALIYFVPKDCACSRRYLRVAVFLFTGVAALFSLFCLVFSNQIASYYNNPSMAGALIYIMPWFWALGVMRICTHALLGMEKSIHAGIISAVHAIIFVIGVASVSLCDVGYLNIIKAYGSIPFISVLPILVYAFAKLPDGQSSTGFKADVAHVLKYSLPLSLSQFVNSTGRQMSMLIVATILMPEKFGIYANGAIELPLVGMLTGSAVAVITPEIVRLYAKDRIEECMRLWQKAAEKTSLIIFPAFIFFMFNAESFMIALFTEKSSAAALPFRLFLLLLPLRIIYFGVIFIAAGKSKLLLLRSAVTTFICALLTLFIAHYYGPMYAPLGLVLAIYFVELPYNLYWFRRLMGREHIQSFAFGNLAQTMFFSCASSVAFIPVHYFSLGNTMALITNAAAYFSLFIIVVYIRKRARW